MLHVWGLRTPKVTPKTPLGNAEVGLSSKGRVSHEGEFFHVQNSYHSLQCTASINQPITIKEDLGEGKELANQRSQPKLHFFQAKVKKKSSWRQLRDPSPSPPWASTWEDRPGTLTKKTHGNEIWRTKASKPKNVTCLKRVLGPT